MVLALKANSFLHQIKYPDGDQYCRNVTSGEGSICRYHRFWQGVNMPEKGGQYPGKESQNDQEYTLQPVMI